MSDQHIHIHPYRLTGSSAHRLEELLMDQNAGALKDGTFHLTNLKGSKAVIVAPEQFSGSNYDQTFLQGIDVKTYKQATSYITAKIRPNSDFNILRTKRLGEYTSGLHVTSSADTEQHRVLILDEPEYFDDNTSPASLGMSGVSGSRAQLDTSVNKVKARIYNKSYRERRDLGQADLFQDGTAYKDTTTVDPTEIVGVKLRGDGSVAGQAVEFPPYMVHATDRTSKDGAIEIFPIRSAADRSIPEHPHTAQGIKSDLNIIDIYRKSDTIQNQSEKLGARKLITGRVVRTYTSFTCTRANAGDNDTIVFTLGGIQCTITITVSGSAVAAQKTSATTATVTIEDGTTDGEFATNLGNAFNSLRALGVRISATVTTNTVFLREVLDRKTTRGVSVTVTDASTSTTKKITTATTIGGFVVEFFRYTDYVYESSKTRALGGYDYYLDGVESFGIEVLDNAESVKLQVATTPMADSDDPNDLVDLDAYVPWLNQMRSGTFGESHIGPINTQGFIAPESGLISPFEDNSDKDITGNRITDANTFASLPNFFLTDKRVTLTGRTYEAHNSLLFQTVWRNSIKSFVTSSHSSSAYGASLKSEIGTEGQPTGVAGTATLSTKNNGNDTHGLTAGQRITLTDHLGSKIDYFVSNTADGGVAHLSSVNEGDVLESSPSGKIVTIKEIQVGKVYKIATLGTGNWEDVGADSTPAVGESFTANAARRTGTNATAYESTVASRSPGSVKGIAVGFVTGASATISYTGQPADGNTITLVSTDGTSKTYEFESGGGVTAGNVSVTISGDDADATYAALKTAIEATGGHLGKIIVTHTDDNNNAGTIKFEQVFGGSSGKTAITATIANSTVPDSFVESTTQNGFLTLLKAAIEHANGHNGTILVSPNPADAGSVQTRTLTQSKPGSGNGNSEIVENLATINATSFSGGEISTSFVKTSPYFAESKHYAMKGAPAFSRNKFPAVVEISGSHHLSGRAHDGTAAGGFKDDSPWTVSYWMSGSDSRATHLTSTRDIIHFKNDPFDVAEHYPNVENFKIRHYVSRNRGALYVTLFDNDFYPSNHHRVTFTFGAVRSGVTQTGMRNSVQQASLYNTLKGGNSWNQIAVSYDGGMHSTLSHGSSYDYKVSGGQTYKNLLQALENESRAATDTVTKGDTINISTANSLTAGTKYVVTSLGTTTVAQWHLAGFGTRRGVGSFTAGKKYVIELPGGTTFTNFGAADNNIGTVFTATGAGSGGGGTAIEFVSSETVSVGDLFEARTTSGTGTGTVKLKSLKYFETPNVSSTNSKTLYDYGNSQYQPHAITGSSDATLACPIRLHLNGVDITDNCLERITHVSTRTTGHNVRYGSDYVDGSGRDFRDIQYTGPDRSLTTAEAAKDNANIPFAGHTISKSKIVIGGLANATSFISRIVKKSSSTNFSSSATISYTGQPDDGDTITLVSTDGTPKTYEFESGGGVTAGNISVTIVSADDADATYANLKTAIDGATGHNAGSAGSKIVVTHTDNNDDVGTVTLRQAVSNTYGFKSNTGDTTITSSVKNAIIPSSFVTFTTTSARTRVYAHQNSNYISEVAMWNTKLSDSNILAIWELSKFNDVLFTVAKPMAEAVTRMGASFEEGVDKDHVHETKGFVFASTEHGTDSLAFGGLKK